MSRSRVNTLTSALQATIEEPLWMIDLIFTRGDGTDHISILFSLK